MVASITLNGERCASAEDTSAAKAMTISALILSIATALRRQRDRTLPKVRCDREYTRARVHASWIRMRSCWHLMVRIE
jgi:hypothetical protein